MTEPVLPQQARFQLPELYPILDVETLERHGIGIRHAACAMVSAGVGILQLRDKRSAPQQVLEHAAALTEAIAGTGCLLVMNDRVDLALLAGWHAVHLGHKDLSPEAARRTSGEHPFLVGVSTHDELQVEAADAGSADYVAIGPVFRTTSKADTEPTVGLQGVRRARQLTGKPLVAIGGITMENAPAVIEAGADSVAVIGALFAAGKSLEATARDFLDRLR